MNKAMVMLAAGVLALSGLIAAEAHAQDSAGPSSTPNAGPGSSPRPQVAPPPARPQAPSFDADMQLEADDAPAPQGGCPDTGRKLELIV